VLSRSDHLKKDTECTRQEKSIYFRELLEYNEVMSDASESKAHGMSDLRSHSFLRQPDKVWRLKEDTIKIDAGIIKDIEADRLDLTMVQSNQRIAEVLYCETVAEGVDRKVIEDHLRTIGIDYPQDKHMAEPINRGPGSES